MPGPFSKPIDASTRICAVYGHPIHHSASPAMQNAGIAALNLNWRYVACEVVPEHLATAIEGARRMHFIGLNLTVPHKIVAMGLMDALDESAKTWGAVNTVRFEGMAPNGEWVPLSRFPTAPPRTRSHGFNTDADAITRALREDVKVEPRGAKILVLGAGGAGRTAIFKLASEGVRELHLVNRTRAKAEQIAEEVRARYPGCNVEVGYPRSEVDLVLNATSLGLSEGDPLPFDSQQFSLGQAAAVYDMIYRPAQTGLLKAAQAARCRTANGLGMLLYQGAKALEIWSGEPAPVEVMRRALEEHIYGGSHF